MFRRRPFPGRPRIPRPRRPRPLHPMPPRPVPPVVRQALRRAHQQLEQGAFEDAAQTYTRLAQAAYARGRVGPGLHMDLEAIRALMQGASYAAARARVLQALRVVLQHRLRLPPVLAIVERLIQQFEEQGARTEADSLRADVDELLDQHGISRADVQPGATSAPATAASASQRHLPAYCPACYAPLRGDELTWVAEDRVQCAYCGTIVLAESS